MPEYHPDMDGPQFVSVVRLGDPAAAQLAVAMLRSAGIPARASGESLGPYRLTVGDLAVTEVWVPEPDLEDAREVLAGSDAKPEPGWGSHTGALADPAALPMRLLAALTVALMVWAVVRFLMQVF